MTKSIAELIYKDYWIEDPSHVCPFSMYDASGEVKMCRFTGPAADVCKLCLLGELLEIGRVLADHDHAQKQDDQEDPE